jgi:hypothetical protein
MRKGLENIETKTASTDSTTLLADPHERNVALSNSLIDLAARIDAEHDAFVVSMQKALAYAIAAGELLMEAKAKLKHGQWLPWISEHCSVPERTCQHYMRLASHARELEAKSASVADLTVTEAVALLAPPATEQGSWEWAEKHATGPIDDFDLENDHCEGTLMNKILYHAGASVNARMFWSLREHHDDALILCPIEELEEVLERLLDVMPQRKRLILPVSISKTPELDAAVIIRLVTQSLFVIFWDEAVERKELRNSEKFYKKQQQVADELNKQLHDPAYLEQYKQSKMRKAA